MRELGKKDPFGTTLDGQLANIWSLGATIYFMLHCFYPLVYLEFKRQTVISILMLMFMTCGKVEPAYVYKKRVDEAMNKVSKTYSDLACRALNELLHVEPEERRKALVTVAEWTQPQNDLSDQMMAIIESAQRYSIFDFLKIYSYLQFKYF